MKVMQNNKGGALAVIVAILFITIFIVNINIIVNKYSMNCLCKTIIDNSIKNAYGNSFVKKDFNQFIRIKNFINPNYKVNKVVILSSIKENDDSDNLFNIELLNDDEKTRLNSLPLEKEEALNFFNLYVPNNLLEQARKYVELNKTVTIIYYQYSKDNINLEDIICMKF